MVLDPSDPLNTATTVLSLRQSERLACTVAVAGSVDLEDLGADGVPGHDLATQIGVGERYRGGLGESAGQAVGCARHARSAR